MFSDEAEDSNDGGISDTKIKTNHALSPSDPVLSQNKLSTRETCGAWKGQTGFNLPGKRLHCRLKTYTTV